MSRNAKKSGRTPRTSLRDRLLAKSRGSWHAKNFAQLASVQNKSHGDRMCALESYVVDHRDSFSDADLAALDEVRQEYGAHIAHYSHGSKAIKESAWALESLDMIKGLYSPRAAPVSVSAAPLVDEYAVPECFKVRETRSMQELLALILEPFSITQDVMVLSTPQPYAAQAARKNPAASRAPRRGLFSRSRVAAAAGIAALVAAAYVGREAFMGVFPGIARAAPSVAPLVERTEGYAPAIPSQPYSTESATSSRAFENTLNSAGALYENARTVLGSHVQRIGNAVSSSLTSMLNARQPAETPRQPTTHVIPMVDLSETPAPPYARPQQPMQPQGTTVLPDRWPGNDDDRAEGALIHRFVTSSTMPTFDLGRALVDERTGMMTIRSIEYHAEFVSTRPQLGAFMDAIGKHYTAANVNPRAFEDRVEHLGLPASFARSYTDDAGNLTYRDMYVEFLDRLQHSPDGLVPFRDGDGRLYIMGSLKALNEMAGGSQ